MSNLAKYKKQNPFLVFPNLVSTQMSKLMKHTMEINNDCSLPFKLWTQLKVDVEQNLNKGSPRNGDHVDVWVCSFKTLKGFFF